MKVRTVVVTVGVVATTSVAGAVIAASPAEAPSGPKSVAEVPAKTYAPTPSERLSERPSKAVKSRESHTDRAGERKSTPTPKATPEKVAKPKSTPKPKRTGEAPKDIHISFYKDCTANPQPCIDAGSLTQYGRGTPILAGHNYDGYAWLATVPEGKRVVVASGPLAGTYRVYGHMQLGRRSGAVPNFGERADLVLQTCVGTGSTGFSLAERV